MQTHPHRQTRGNNENVLTPVRRQASAKKIEKRYGLQELRIGANIRHPLTASLEIPSRIMTENYGIPSTPKLLKAGDEIDRTARDITRVPDETFELCRWHCVVPNRVQSGEVNVNPWQPCPCMKSEPGGYESKDDLQAAHAPNTDLVKRHEIHLVYGVAILPARGKKKEVREKETGKLIEAADPGRAEEVVVLSSTEI